MKRKPLKTEQIGQGIFGGPTFIIMTPELEREFEQDRKDFFEDMERRIKQAMKQQKNENGSYTPNSR